MKTKWLHCICLLVATVVVIQAQEGASERIRPTPSAKRVGAIHIEQGEDYAALGEISEKANVPIGVEVIRPKKGDTAIAIDFIGGSVADLLKMFVLQQPDYTWADTNNGIIHVSPRNGHISVLDVAMNYPEADRKTRKQIWEDISSRPEIAAWMESNQCARGELFHGREFRDHNLPISITAGILTLQQLLDQVALKSGDNYWAVVQSSRPERSCQISIMLW